MARVYECVMPVHSLNSTEIRNWDEKVFALNSCSTFFCSTCHYLIMQHLNIGFYASGLENLTEYIMLDTWNYM